MTKDADFQSSFELGQGPPRLLLITTGNIHNDDLLALFSRHERDLAELFDPHSFLELNRTRIVVRR